MFKAILYSLPQVSGKSFLKIITNIGHFHWKRFEIVEMAFRAILPKENLRGLAHECW